MPEGVQEKQAGAHDQKRIGDVKIRPAPIIIGLPEDPIADRVEGLPVLGDAVQAESIV